MTARTLIAAAVLFAYLMATIGTRTAVVRLREAWREAIALGFLNAAAPFWLDRLGRAAHRLGRSGDRPGDGADLLAADRAQVPAPRAHRRRPDRRRLPRPRRRCLRRRRHARGRHAGRHRHARRRPRVGVLRLGGHLQPAPPQGHDLRPGARDGLDARRRHDPAAARDPRSADVDADGGRDRIAAAAGAARHRARAAAPLPGRRPLRSAPAQPRHVPAAGLRARATARSSSTSASTARR